jgi:hypothetical protein
MTAHSRKFWPPKSKDAPKGPYRACDQPGCTEHGEFRAPKSRNQLTEYYWFCLEHVRRYNQSWDYYAGLKPEEIEQMVRLDTTWQRPTWPLGRMSGGRWQFDPERVKDSFGVFDEEMWQKPKERNAPPSPEELAMQMMELSWPLTIDSLKARYKELCKLHHPDANNGDKDAEERFKLIGQAYQTLMGCLAAQDQPYR